MEFILTNWLGLTGFISGVVCVWLLIRENVLTFPVGLIYAVVSVVAMYGVGLYADVLLNFYYVLMNAYGWYFWLYGGAARRAQDELLVTWVPKGQWVWLVIIGAAGTFGMGWYFANFTDASLPYPDSFTTVCSFVAMWMSARKYMESWFLWFVVNVISVVLYLIKAGDDGDLYFWAALYAIYIPMAVMGYRSWRLHLQADPYPA